MNQFAVDRRNGVLLVKFVDAISPATLDALNDELKAFVASNGTMPMIIDLAAAPSTELKTSTFVSRGRIPSQMRGKRRVFVSNNPPLFGLLRVYGAHQEHVGEEVPVIVSSLTAAFEELSLIDPVFEPLAVEANRT